MLILGLTGVFFFLSLNRFAVLGLRHCARRLSLVMSRGYSSCSAQACCSGFSGCRAWALGTWAPVVAAHGFQSLAQWLRHMGLVAPWHVGSSQTRNRTSVPFIARQVLNHWITREAPSWVSQKIKLGLWILSLTGDQFCSVSLWVSEIREKITRNIKFFY